MKKIFSVLFFFLFIGTVLTGSGFLLAGCNYSQSQENSDNKIENGNNQTGDNEDDLNDDVEGQQTVTDTYALGVCVADRFPTLLTMTVQSINASMHINTNYVSEDGYSLSNVGTASIMFSGITFSGGNDKRYSTTGSGVAYSFVGSGASGGTSATFTRDFWITAFGSSSYTASYTVNYTINPIAGFGVYQKFVDFNNSYDWDDMKSNKATVSPLPTDWKSTSSTFTYSGSTTLYKDDNKNVNSLDEKIAIVAPLSYEITYMNGSTVHAQQYTTFTHYYNLPSNPSKAGYTFAGWYTGTNGTGSKITSTTYKTSAGEQTLYAHWTLNSYTITYDSDGGSKPSNLSYNITSTNTLPSSSKSGYTFVGWKPKTSVGNWNSGSTYKSGTSVNGKYGTVTLVAQWTPNTYSNTYHYRSTTGSSTTSSGQNRTYGTSFTTYTTSSVSEYVSNGWSLYGWATSSSTYSRNYGVGVSVSDYNSSTSTVNLYAISSRTISLSYNANGGTNAPSSSSSTQYWNQVGNAYNLTTITISSSVPKRDGYSFLGWSTSSTATTATYKAGNSYSFTYSTANAVTLYAVWQANTYYVKFNGNNATSGSMSNQTFTYDKAQNLTANAFSRTGYTFAGWATSASGLVAYTDKQSVKNLTTSNGATVNLYAKWNVVSYTITYDENGGNPVSDLSYTIESTSTLTSTTRTGYTFNGWKPSASSGSWSSGTTYKAGESVNGRYGSVTLVAQWTAKQYTLTLKGNGGTPDTQVMSPKLIFDGGNWNNVAGSRPTMVGFTFTGFYTSATGGEQVYDKDGSCVEGAYWEGNKYKHDGDLTVYAHWQANNPAYYDEEGGYWYVEIGMYPQTRATQTEISGIGSSNGNSYVINGKTYTAKIGANNTEFVQYNGVWYKVEPIKWRLTGNSSQKVGYGTTDDTLAIMDTIVYAGQFEATNVMENSTTLLKEAKTFNGTSDYIAVGRECMYTDKITVSVWVHQDDWTEFNGIGKVISCTEGGGWCLLSDTYPNVVAMGAYDQGVGYKHAVSDISYSSLSSGWHHFTFTFDGTNLKLYLDGALVATSQNFTSGKIGYNSVNGIFIGAEAGPNTTTPAGGYFKGAIKDVVIAHDVLTAEEIRNLGNNHTQNIYNTMDTSEINYLVNFKGTEESYSNTGIVETSRQGNIFISSEEEIQQVAGSYEVKFSDLVKDILGITIYFTRDMGTNINNISCRTEYGGLTQKFATSVQGFQFTIKVSEYGCVS